ncbi:MAG: hypothetical protein HY681_13155, partial [Chloroflexi bacterium]|nr:hypothetical protein [Chloroflexota bacterium]
GLEVEAGAIHVLPETQTVCRALGLDLLGLLASGSLLLTLPVVESARLVDALARMDVTSAVIGRVTPKERGVMLATAEGIRDMPQFARDELARYLSGRG